MTLKLTARDRRILYWLCLFIIAFGLWYFLIKPAQEKNNELMELITAGNIKLTEYGQKAESLSDLIEAYKSASNSYQAEVYRFYPNMSSSAIDRLFTGLAVRNGLQADLFNVDIYEDDSVIAPYVLSDLAADTQETGLSGLRTAAVTLEVSGSKSSIYTMIDEICALKAVRLIRLDWWPYCLKSSALAYYRTYIENENETMLRLELELYMRS